MKKVLLLATLVAFMPAVSVAYSQTTALDYLESNQDSPWAIMALANLERSGLNTDFLKNPDTSEAIKFEADMLAITALGEDPRNFGDMDLVAKLEEFYVSSQLGSNSQLNDDIFGGLALVSAGMDINESILQDVKSFVLSNQNSNGSWGWQVGSQDIDTTAATLMFLSAMGMSSSDSAISSALVWLRNSQNDDGGWPYDPDNSWGTASAADSTAWVISALQKLGEDMSSWSATSGDPETFLQSLQTSSGYFEYQSGFGESGFSKVTTSYAVLALAGKSYPVNTINYTTPDPDSVSADEGNSNTGGSEDSGDPDSSSEDPSPENDSDSNETSSDNSNAKTTIVKSATTKKVAVTSALSWTLKNPYGEDLHLMDYVLVDQVGRRFTIPRGKMLPKNGSIRFPSYYLTGLDTTGPITVLTPEGEVFKVLKLSTSTPTVKGIATTKVVVKVLQFNNSSNDPIELVDYYLLDALGNKFTLPTGKMVSKNSFVRMPKHYTTGLDLSGQISLFSSDGELVKTW